MQVRTAEYAPVDGIPLRVQPHSLLAMPVACLLGLTAVYSPEVQAQRPAGPTELILGGPGSPSAVRFGKIREVKVNHHGDIFVLDESAGGVLWFDEQGIYRTTIGAGGTTARALVAPLDFTIMDDGQLHVLDGGDFKVSQFSLIGGQVQRTEDQRLGVQGLAVCVARGRRFVHTPRIGGGMLIHELDAMGNSIRAFARPMVPDTQRGWDLTPEFYTELNVGDVGCDGRAGRVILTSNLLGTVRAYSLNGELIWTVPVPGFHRVQLSRAPGHNECCVLRPNPRTGTYQYVVGAVPGPSDRVWVTIVDIDAESRRERYRTAILRGSDGGLLLDQPSTMIVRGFHHEHPYGYTRAALSRVVVVSDGLSSGPRTPNVFARYSDHHEARRHGVIR